METIIYAANTSCLHASRNTDAQLDDPSIPKAIVELPVNDESISNVVVVPSVAVDPVIEIEIIDDEPKPESWKAKRDRKKKIPYGLIELPQSDMRVNDAN
jgi:hypothetical protein